MPVNLIRPATRGAKVTTIVVHRTETAARSDEVLLIGPGLALHCKPVTVRTPHLRRAHAGRTIHGEQLSFRNAANRGECPWISDCKASAPL